MPIISPPCRSFTMEFSILAFSPIALPKSPPPCSSVRWASLRLSPRYTAAKVTPAWREGGAAGRGNSALADETQIALSYNDVNASHLIIQIFCHQFVLLWRNIFLKCDRPGIFGNDVRCLPVCLRHQIFRGNPIVMRIITRWCTSLVSAPRGIHR